MVYAQTINIDPAQRGVPINAVKSVGDIISAGIGVIFLLAGLLVFIMLVWGGIQWITSGGDKEKTQSARDRITHALVGLAIVASAWALTQIVQTFFGITILGDIQLPRAAR